MARQRDPERRLDALSVAGGVGWMLVVTGIAVTVALALAAAVALAVRLLAG